MKRNGWILLLWVALMLAAPASAQDEMEITTFDAAGLTHYVYYAPRYVDRVEPIIAVLGEAFTLYDGLWATPAMEPMFVELVDDVAIIEFGDELYPDVSEILGEATINEVTVPGEDGT